MEFRNYLIILFVLIVQGCSSLPTRDISVVTHQLNQVSWQKVDTFDEVQKQQIVDLLLEAIRATKPLKSDCLYARSLQCLNSIVHSVAPYIDKIYRLSTIKNTTEGPTLRFYIHVGQNGRVVRCKIWDKRFDSPALTSNLTSACENLQFLPGEPHVYYLLPVRLDKFEILDSTKKLTNGWN